MRGRDTESRALTPDGSVSKRLCPCFLICSGCYNPMEKRVAERRAWRGATTGQPGASKTQAGCQGPTPQKLCPQPQTPPPRGPTRTPGGKDAAPALPRGSNSCAIPEHRMEGRKGGFAQRAPGWGWGEQEVGKIPLGWHPAGLNSGPVPPPAPWMSLAKSLAQRL